MQLTTAPAELDGFLETEAGQVDLFFVYMFFNWYPGMYYRISI